MSCRLGGGVGGRACRRARGCACSCRCAHGRQHVYYHVDVARRITYRVTERIGDLTPPLLRGKLPAYVGGAGCISTKGQPCDPECASARGIGQGRGSKRYRAGRCYHAVEIARHPTIAYVVLKHRVKYRAIGHKSTGSGACRPAHIYSLENRVGEGEIVLGGDRAVAARVNPQVKHDLAADGDG